MLSMWTNDFNEDLMTLYVGTGVLGGGGGGVSGAETGGCIP